MSDCSKNKNPLVRQGTSQGQRVLEKLSPTSVEILDKSDEDWMVWAGKFSDHISFTSLNNGAVGSMKPFFTSDISAQLSLAAGYEPEILSQYIRELLQFLEVEDGFPLADQKLEKIYTQLFDIIFSYFIIADKLYRLTLADKEYNAILLNHIKARLLPTVKRSFTYYKASLDESLMVDSIPTDLNIFFEPLTGHQNAIDATLSNLSSTWYVGFASFSAFYGALASDPSIFGNPAGSIADKIKYATQHNFFTSILDEISASTTFITKLSQKYLSKYLTDWPGHQPHYALYLTWLQLLDDTKAHLNELTGRHLDFYYKDVLQLKPLAEDPDSAFLVMELNRVTPFYALKDDTQFMGPKDKNGNLITYESIRETILNKAKIKHLTAMYYGAVEDNIGTQINNRRLFAAPVINSADGLGEKLAEHVIAWHPFHIKEYVNAELDSINMPKAEIGFAISSHYLRLGEGKRTIILEISISNNVKFNEFAYQAFITMEKEWFPIEQIDLDRTLGAGGKVTKITFTFDIPADKDPIVAYNKEVHLGSLTATEPVLKIVLEHNDTLPFIYDTLSQAKISTAKLTVKVGEINDTYNEEGIKNLELHNDSSPLNPSKPFQPWGPEPKSENSLIIGSDEIFYKKGANIQLNFEWNEYFGTTISAIDSLALVTDGDLTKKEIEIFTLPTVDVLTLSNNKWEPLDTYQDVKVFRTTSIPDFNFTQKTVLKIDLSSKNETLFYSKDDVWEGYLPNTNKGFVKIKLNDDFGHKDYYEDLMIFAKDKNDLVPPIYPYQPTLQFFSVGYEASCSLDLATTDSDTFNNRPLEFYHVGPFGDSEQHRVLQNETRALLGKLIIKTDSNFKSQGSLFIGLENLHPGDTQSILFQLQEGSENPLLEKPENHLIWEYLTVNNVWELFDDDGVGDNTSGLIESGLINFTIPKDASLEHTAFESNLIWIRCSVKEAPDAVSKIIGIYPNAIEAQRVIPEATEYETMVAAAGEIKKLLVPEAKIKKIDQPYTSFDGKPTEGSEAFYLRASERLRHKDRAINIWDIEHLVLQAFPEIYKIKCLNHTKIEGSLSEGDLVYNEVAPGHIAVITIPNLANRNDIDPLKPYTKKSTLNNIKEFLRERTSCQVSLHTAQPDFEEVKIKCVITLRKEFPDVNYYKEVIQNDIMNFLSPWAFSSDTDLNFGGRIHQSVLIDFIEELPNVDFLTDFELYHINSSGVTTKVDEAIASTGRSILVSVPAIKHDLTVLLKTPEAILEIDCTNE